MTFGPNTTDIKRSQLNAADGEVVFYDDDDDDDGDDDDDDDDSDNTLNFQTFQISLKIYRDENAYFAFCVQLPDLVVVAPF